MLSLESGPKRSRDEDTGGEVEDDGTTKGVMKAMHMNVDQSELFALFSALGGRSSNNSSSTNRNPLPRGRACESVDWLTELFKFLAPTSSSIGVSSVRVPMTLVFRHSKPHTWYISGRSAGVHESATSGDSDEIIARLVNASDATAAMIGLEGQVDIVAYYASTTKPAGVNGRPRTRIEYFDESLLRDFMKHRPTKPDGILQLFVVPTGSKSACVRARYAQGRVSVETRTNSYYITDTKHSVMERGATFDGDEHCPRAGHVPPQSALFTSVSKQLKEILTHVDTCIGDAYGIAEATAYFRVHSDSKLYFLWMPSVLLCHSSTGQVIHPENLPESPRAAKPVLAYAGSLPKDFFRCPCCGKVVAASEKARVPYLMMLQHIKALDEADGVADGDSAALRSIAATLDKVSRNPQYYADLYRAVDRSNPAGSTLAMLQKCGYPGGDLELDDHIESPAELICFRLLQLACIDRKPSGRPDQLSIAHYKWVRDNKPKLLHKIGLYVCTDCSLGVSNTAFDNQSRAFSQLSAAKNILLESQQPKFPSVASLDLGRPGSDLETSQVSSVGGRRSRAGRTTRELLDLEPEEPPPESLTDNTMRKSMSLPLLRPKLDRAKVAQSRPWRQPGTKRGGGLTAVSEEPRFEPVGALNGKGPAPDPRFIPYLQYQQYEEEKKEFRKRQKSVVPPPLPPPRKPEEGEGGFFMTQGGGSSLPQIPFRPAGNLSRSAASMRMSGRGRHSPHHRMGGAASDAALDAISDVAAGQEALDMKIGALNERMARLEGSLGPARQALSKKQALLQKRLVSDEKTAEAVAEIRKHLLANLPRVVDLFRSFDKNGDGLVSQREFRLVLPMLNLGKSYGSAEMDAVFGALDRDGSGFVDLKEMQKMLRKGADVTLAKELQDGAKGEIEVEARNRYSLRTEATEGDLKRELRLASVEELRDSLVSDAKRIIDLFRAFDINGDGKVTKAEFRAALPMLGFDASNGPNLDLVFDAMDAQGKQDGELEYEELERALRRTDIVLKKELQAGAVAFDMGVEQAFDLRKTHLPSDGIVKAPLREATVEAMARSIKFNAARVTDLLKSLDINGDGFVTKREFREALPLLGFGQGGHSAIDALFDQLDASGDGKLEYAELAAKLSRQVAPMAAKVHHPPAQGNFAHLL